MKFFREPWQHQKEAIDRAMAIFSPDPQQAGFALFFEPGAGKTGTAINILRSQINTTKTFMRTLVFCPPIVIRNWKNEFLMNSKIPPERIIPLTGPGKKRLKTFEKLAYEEGQSFSAGDPRAVIFVTNYESLLMGDLYQAFKSWQPEHIIFDESHELKTYNAKRSQLAERLANGSKVIPYKQILTGTPMLKDPMDLFHQFLILDGGRTLGGNFFAFRARFFRDRNAGMPKQKYFPKWELMTKELEGFDALAELNRLIGPRSMSVRKEDCMDLPPLVRTVIQVEMSPEQRRMYNEMKRDFITFMADPSTQEQKASVALMAMTKALRLQQIASGYIKTNEEEEIAIDGSPKMDALKQLLAQITPHSKVLVWAAWRQNYEQIRHVCQELGLKWVELIGGMTETARHEAEDRLENDPEVRVLLGNPGSGGIGVNLVAASYAITFSRSFSLKHKVQAEARNYRGGSERHEKITHYDLVCEDSIDEIISEKLASKIEMSDKLLRDLSQELSIQGDL